MKGKGGPFDVNVIVISESFNTPGNEIAPGSNVITKYFQQNWFRHECPPQQLFQFSVLSEKG
jgi:hypothetical protein